MYVFELATTGTISFGDFVSSGSLVAQIGEATQLRSRVRAVLKEHRAGSASTSTRPRAGSKDVDLRTPTSPIESSVSSESDWTQIIGALEAYLPSVVAVFNCVQTDDLLLRYEPVFSWRTCLSSWRFRAPQRIDLAGLHYELASVLLTYALALANLATTTVASLGNFERERGLSGEERKAKDERLRWSADTMCRAAGVLVYLSEELLPKWRSSVGMVEGVPPELTSEATLALSKVCMAHAQALAIRKLVSPSIGIAVDTLTPGPPLDRSHPSPSLLAKLHLNVVEQLDSALGLLKTVGGKTVKASMGNANASEAVHHEDDLARRVSAQEGDGKTKLLAKLRLGKDRTAGRVSGPHDATPTSTGSGGGRVELEISSSLLRYLGSSVVLHRALAYKWLAIDAGENGERTGEAIALLALGSSLLSKDGSGLAQLSLSKRRERGAEAELATIDHWLAAYRKLNDTVAFQPVPSAQSVQAKVPAGRAALAVKTYTLPEPRFGPGSAGYTGRGGELDTENLHRLSADHPARANLVGLSPRQAGHYAGHGAYY